MVHACACDRATTRLVVLLCMVCVVPPNLLGAPADGRGSWHTQEKAQITFAPNRSKTQESGGNNNILVNSLAKQLNLDDKRISRPGFQREVEHELNIDVGPDMNYEQDTMHLQLEYARSVAEARQLGVSMQWQRTVPVILPREHELVGELRRALVMHASNRDGGSITPLLRRDSSTGYTDRERQGVFNSWSSSWVYRELQEAGQDGADAFHSLRGAPLVEKQQGRSRKQSPSPTLPSMPHVAEPPEWPELDMDLAMTLGQIEIVSYCADLARIAGWNCTRCRNVSGFEPTDVVFDANKDVLGMTGWSSALQAKVVAFRGTNSHDIWNWVDDMRAWRIDFQVPIAGAEGAKIHAGFWDLWAGGALADNITQAYSQLLEQQPEGPTYILGHSMGAALAQLCALWFKATFRDTFPDRPGTAAGELRLITWGAPRVGNSVFANLVANVSSGHWRFTHGRDVVPSVPPQLLGYQHTPQEMWLIEVTDPISQQVFLYVVECDMSGEDPLCHNSVCHLGICTSVADHLDYMGLHFYLDALEC